MSKEQVEHSAATHCYAYRERSGVIDVDSISETPAGVREKYLEACMGWRFNHPDRYSRDEEWARLLTFGSVVHVMVSLGEGECDAWKCESCDKVE